MKAQERRFAFNSNEVSNSGFCLLSVIFTPSFGQIEMPVCPSVRCLSIYLLVAPEDEDGNVACCRLI